MPTFRGWWVVLGCFGSLFAVFGAAYSFGPLFPAFEQAFGASRAGVSSVFAWAGLLYFLVGLPAGLLADRYGPRRVALPGMLALAAGLVLASRAQSLNELVAAYALALGLGVGLVYVPSVGAVQPWFLRKRGLASGLGVAGIGVGTFVVPLAAALLLERLDWRDTLVWMAAVLGVLGLAAASLLDNRPQAHGLGPDGDPPVPGAPAGTPGIAFGAALRQPAFWRFYLAIFLFTTTAFIPFVHLVPHARDLGVDGARASLLIGLIGFGSMAGRFATGGFADRLGRHAACVLAFGALGLCSVLWWAATGFATLAAFALLHGLAYGVSVALFPSLVMDRFGARNVSGLIGLLYTGAGFASLAGPLLTGAWHDHAGRYDAALLASAAAGLAAAAVMGRRSPVDS